ncbi:FAD-binding protein [Agromyces soli]
METTLTAPGLVEEVAALPLREALARLADRLDGRLVQPGDPEWDASRAAWNLAVDQRPAAVVVARSADDVVRTVELAAGYGLAVAPQGTGHNAAPLAAGHGLADAVLLRTHELRDIRIDAEQALARVEAGVCWGELVAAAAEHGLAALAGSSHDVGVVGYTLGGGLSWLARSHGLASSHVVAIELVTADGRLRRVDAEHDAELFWALRGGGGDFGVVTAIEFRLLPIGELVAGMLLWPAERAAEVLEAWSEWTSRVPDGVQSAARILHLPPLPELPPFLAGRSVVVVEAVLQETTARAAELLAPLRALHPEVDTVRAQAPAELLALHMDPPGPVPGRGDGFMLRSMPGDAVRAFVEAAGAGSGTALMSIEIRQLGGALEPDAAVALAAEHGLPVPGALPGFESAFLVFGVGMVAPAGADGPAVTAAAASAAQSPVDASLHRLRAALAPWRSPESYLNFAERSESPEGFFGGRLARLRAVKRLVDPTRVIRSNHPVG